MNTVVKLAKEGLSLWRVFLSTRQEAYQRHLDKKQNKAIQYGEAGFKAIKEVYAFVHECMDIPKERKKEWDRLKVKIYRLSDKFDKFD